MSELRMRRAPCRSVKGRSRRRRVHRDMGLAVQRLAACLLCCIGLGCWSASPSEAASPAGGLASSAFGSPLVVPGVQSLDEDQQLRAAEEARLSNPVLVAAREASRTEFEHLGAVQARALDGRTFPAVVDDLAGGPPQLPAGQTLVRYTSDDSAQVDLPGGKHAVIASLQPMASEAAPGHLTPLNLTLAGVGGAFEPKTPVVGVRIPKRLQDGVALSNSGVSLTALDAQGRALTGSEGTLDGASVLYASTQTASDTLAKATPGGFELDSLLRGAESPQTLYYRVGLPAGARLVAAGRGSRAVAVMDRNKEIAVVSAPSAEDAEGVPVPLSTHVSGDLLSIEVDHRSTSYGYPIVVDPTVEENVKGKGEILYGKTWGFFTKDGAIFHGGALDTGVEDHIALSGAAGESGFFYYPTRGESKIYSVTATTLFEPFSGGWSEVARYVENTLGILNVHSKTLEAQQSWIGAYAETSTSLCSSGGCAAGNVTPENDASEVVFKQDLREPDGGGYAKLLSAKIGITQEAGPSVSWNTTEENLENAEEDRTVRANGMIPGKWIYPGTSYWSFDWAGIDAFDPGVGLLRESWSSPDAPSWHGEIVKTSPGGAVQMNDECGEPKCGGSPGVVSDLYELPEGEDTIDATVEDFVGLKASTSGIVKIDKTKPYNMHLVGLPANNEVGFGRDRLQAVATEGSGSTPASGITSIKLQIDGKNIGSPNGSCSVPAGPCTATGQWSINGEEYAAGKHIVTIEATTGAGLWAREETTITFVSSESKHVGPGTVDLASGAFTLDTTDVAVAGAGTSLTIERSYDSRLATEGNEGPLGPQWQGLSFGGNEKLTKVPTGSVILTASSGQSAIFTKEGSSFLSPAGDAGLTLKEESPSLFTLSDQHGDVTKFTAPEGGSGTVLTPYSREEPGVTGSARYTFQTVAGITEPTQALAPAPAGVSCATLVKGCRALSFSYASKTTATGEAPEEWGEYAGRLVKISFTAYNPTSKETSKEMQTIAVAQYAYDKQGRLRAEWDPRVSPALKTLYGYDPEGHITAVTPPGEQPWLLRYGTIESDPTPGRLLSVTRPSASTAFGNDLAPANSEAPKLSSTTPVLGEELSVSNGAWSNSPLSYSYQWERCNVSGAECTILPGATNQAYTVRYGDEEHTLAVLVTAANAGGSGTGTTTTSAMVPAKASFPWRFVGTFGSPGSKEEELKSPSYIAFGKATQQTGGLYVTDTGNDRVAVYTPGGQFLREFGSAGSGETELDEPTGIAAFDGEPEVWIADDGNKRLVDYNDIRTGGGSMKFYREQKLTTTANGIAFDEDSATGDRSDAFVAETGTLNQVECLGGGYYASGCQSFYGESSEDLAFGSTGSGPGELSDPADVAISPVSNEIYVLDSGNDRVEYFSGSPLHFGEYLGQFGVAGSNPGQLKEPKGIAVDSHGDVWVTDTGNGRVQVFSASGNPLLQLDEQSDFGEKSRKAIREEDEKKIHEEEDKEPPKQRKAREKREAKETAAREKREAKERKELEKKKLPTPRQEEEKQVEAEKRGDAPPHLDRPMGIALGPNGEAYVVDSGDDRVMMWTGGKRPAEPPLPPATPPSAGSSAVWTIDYQVPVSGTSTGAPNLSATEVSKWGQTKDEPMEGTAIFPPDEPMGWPASDYRRASIFYLDSKGHTVNTAAPEETTTAGEYKKAISTAEYNSNGDVERTLSADNRIAALAKGGSAASELATVNTYNSEGTELRSTTGPEHPVKLSNGDPIQARKIAKYSYDEGAPAEGGPYALVTKGTDAALNESGSGEEDVRTTTTSYAGEGWKLRKPTSVTADAGGLGLGHVTAYEAETGNVIETREPANTAEKSPHATETIYYTAGVNPKAAACGEHLEWVDLPCRTQPAKQPETAGLPNLPVTTVTKYNIWDEPETTEETVGAKTRVKTATYDAAGRLETSTTTSNAGTAIPPVTYRYSAETGALVSQTSAGRTITSVYNALGELVSYTDADANTTSYTYNIDGQPKTINDGKGTETLTYSTTTGLPTELVNEYGTSKLTFTATYDPEGRLLSEGYPNGMAAKYTYNAVGEATALEYVKTSHCSSGCTWFSDSVVPSIEGQWMSQTSTLSGQTSSQSYSYDGVGRLTQAQSTPAGKGCTTRIYAYDRDTNRTSLTTREPTPKGQCAAKGESGETQETHTYDEADRLTDPGVTYNEFGAITALPPAEAGGSELTNTYYSDNQMQSMTQHKSQTQPEETIGYNLDPAGRIRETIATGQLNTSDVISHYTGPGETPAWTANTSASGEEWTRNIPGINGRLAAVQNDGETPVLQLSNLHGDIIATAYLSEAATSLASTIKEATEFGVPATEAPPKYSWLGAIELPTELPSGVIAMGARSYIPQLGRFLQPDPIPGGSANAYNYTYGNPLNTTDPTGESTEYTIGGPSAAAIAWATQSSAEAAAQQAAENAAARAAAERLAQEEEAQQAAAYGPLGGEGEWEEWEEYEEEGGYEWASYKHNGETSKEEAHIEPAVLYQPLVEGGGPEDGGERSGASAGPPSSAYGTHSHYYHRYKSDYRGPSTWEQFVCGVTPLVKLMAEQSNVGNAIVHESRPRCG